MSPLQLHVYLFLEIHPPARLLGTVLLFGRLEQGLLITLDGILREKITIMLKIKKFSKPF